jgi:hypothetical protein
MLSVYIIENINFFGTLGGFEAITKRLSQMAPPTASTPSASASASAASPTGAAAAPTGPVACNWATIKGLFRMLSAVRSYLDLKFCKSWVPDVCKAAFARLRDFNDEDVRFVDKEGLADTVREFEQLMLMVQKPNDVAETIEKLSLVCAVGLTLRCTLCVAHVTFHLI